METEILFDSQLLSLEEYLQQGGILTYEEYKRLDKNQKALYRKYCEDIFTIIEEEENRNFVDIFFKSDMEDEDE